VVVAVAIPVIEPAGELRDGWIRRAGLEPLGAEDGAADRTTETMRTTKASPEGPSPTEDPARYI
jgi:hypothetical protein